MRTLRSVSLFACCVSLVSAGNAFADERSAVNLDFTPLGEHVVSTAAGTAAPADVNFGSFPLSVLGIENTIRTAETLVPDYARGTRRVDDGPIAYAVVAIRDWEHKYPSDPWIAKDILALAKFYTHVGTSQARDCAERAAHWVAHDYPKTAYANGAQRLIADLGAPETISEQSVTAYRPQQQTVSAPSYPSAPTHPIVPAYQAAPAYTDPQPEAGPAYVPAPQAQGDPPPYAADAQRPYVVRRRASVPVPQATLPPYAHYEYPTQPSGNR